MLYRSNFLKKPNVIRCIKVTVLKTHRYMLYRSYCSKKPNTRGCIKVTVKKKKTLYPLSKLLFNKTERNTYIVSKLLFKVTLPSSGYGTNMQVLIENLFHLEN